MIANSAALRTYSGDVSKLLVQPSDHGLWCEAAGLHVDPWRAVQTAVVTHGHADHAATGCETYICSPQTAAILRARYGIKARFIELAGGEFHHSGSTRLSLHPAGHILGSMQVRIETVSSVTVVTGDYKTAPDPTCEPFELVECDAILTESTFGLPVFRWKPQQVVFDDMNRWWRANSQEGLNSVVFAYSLGKAQRVLAGVDPSIGPILVHGAVEKMLSLYREAGLSMPEVHKADKDAALRLGGRALIVAPPGAAGTPWIRKFTPYSTAFASGWMAIRGARRWRSVDRGFVISDHADWDGLLDTIQRCRASFVGVTHGYSSAFARYLREHVGIEAQPISTRYTGEADAESDHIADIPSQETSV